MGTNWLLLICLVCLSGRCIGQTYGDFGYSVSGTNITITNYTGSGGAVAIPSTIPGVAGTVTSIGYGAFLEDTALTSVTIPNGVTNIGDLAFFQCSALTSVTIGNRVTTIGNLAFFRCSGLTSVTIPGSVTAIGLEAFYTCSALTSITLSDGVASIGNSAFYACNGLTNVTIPGSVTNIGSEAFYTCSALTSITISDGVASIGGSAFSGCSGLTSVTVPDSVTNLGAGVFENCTGLTNVTIGSGVTNIGVGVFNGCSGLGAIAVAPQNPSYSSLGGVLFNKNQTTLVAWPPGDTGAYAIPSSVTSIGGGAFYGCGGLTSISIPGSVTSIGTNAFSACSALASVTLPAGVTNLGAGAFQACSGLATVTLPANVTSIGGGTFYGCDHLTSITIPASVTSIGDKAFEGSALTSVTIPNGVTSIGAGAFSFCFYLGSVTIPNSVTSIGQHAFQSCGLTSVTIPGSVTNFGDWAFEECGALASVTILNGVTSIGSYAFYYCGALGSVTIAGSVTSIGESAFQACGLTSAVFQGDAPASFGMYVFSGAPQGFTIYYPSTAPGWTTPTWNGYPTHPYATVAVAVLASPATGGSVFGGGTFPSGSNVTVTATPWQGYAFVNWTENGIQVSETANYTFTATTNWTLTANFTPLWTVATSATPAGAGSTSGGGTFPSGSNVTVTATPGQGYAFVNWTENGIQVSESANYTFTATTNRTLTADFAPTYTVTTTASPTGAGAISGAGTYTNGSLVLLTATPSPGCHFVDWTELGTVLGSSNQLTLLVATNRNLVGNFATNPADVITVSASPGNGGRMSGGGTFKAGTSRTVTATPNNGYIFANWTENGAVVSGSASYTFTLHYDRDLVANFVSNPFPAVSGSYYGLFYDETNGVSPQSSGCFTITTTSKGGVSGSLQVGGIRYSLTGQFSETGTASNIIARGSAGALAVDLRLDLANGTDRLLGSVGNLAWTATLTGDRAVYDGKTSIAPEAGSYTMIIAGDYGSTISPGGDSYATLTVSKSGVVSLKGTLADGKTITPKAPVSKNGQWPLYASLYSGQGVLWGWLTFTNASELGGSVAWIKPALNTTPYPAGFSLTARALGERYVPPGKGTNVFGLTVSTNLTLTLVGGGLDVADHIALEANDQVTTLSGPKLNLTFTPTTGAFSGSVANPPSSKPISFGGVVLQSQGTGSGFLLGTEESGEVRLEQ
jgi:hypothetical protein